MRADKNIYREIEEETQRKQEGTPQKRRNALTEELLLSEIQMVSRSGFEEDAAGLVRGLEAEGVLQVPVGLLHGKHRAELSIGVVAPPLALVGKDHGILQGLDHRELLGLEKVGLESRVADCAFVVPAAQLALGQVALFVDLGGVTQVVGLEQNALHKRIICEVTSQLQNA